MADRLQMVKRYFSLLENFSTNPSDFSDILHPEFSQREFPNALNKNGQISDRADIFRRAELGKKMMRAQSFEISKIVEQTDSAVVECLWNGTMAIDAGPLKNGQQLKAFFCIVLDFKDGKIHRQRNYDCFEPF